MIDDILEMILKEARGRKGRDLTSRVAMVLIDIVERAIKIIDNEAQEERRKREDENKV
jgi:hypothetical protein